MTISEQTTSPPDTTREAGPSAHAQSVVTVQDTAHLESGDPRIERNGSNGRPPETTLPPPGPAHRPFAYPAWPTSQPGPQVTPPLPGQHPHPLRTDQMVYSCYDQERGMPCVLPPRLAEHRKRTSLPDADCQEVVSETEALQRWFDDGGSLPLAGNQHAEPVGLRSPCLEHDH